MNSLLANLIPPKFTVGQNFCLGLHAQIAISLSIFDGFQQAIAQTLSQMV